MQKNEAVSSICFGEILDLKILQSEWLRAFTSIYPKNNIFFQIEDLYKKEDLAKNVFPKNLARIT